MSIFRGGGQHSASTACFTSCAKQPNVVIFMRALFSTLRLRALCSNSSVPVFGLLWGISLVLSHPENTHSLSLSLPLKREEREREPTERANKSLKAKLDYNLMLLYLPLPLSFAFPSVFFFFLFSSHLVGFLLSCDNICVLPLFKVLLL